MVADVAEVGKDFPTSRVKLDVEGAGVAMPPQAVFAQQVKLDAICPRTVTGAGQMPSLIELVERPACLWTTGAFAQLGVEYRKIGRRPGRAWDNNVAAFPGDVRGPLRDTKIGKAVVQRRLRAQRSGNVRQGLQRGRVKTVCIEIQAAAQHLGNPPQILRHRFVTVERRFLHRAVRVKLGLENAAISLQSGVQFALAAVDQAEGHARGAHRPGLVGNGVVGAAVQVEFQQEILLDMTSGFRVNGLFDQVVGLKELEEARAGRTQFTGNAAAAPQAGGHPRHACGRPLMTVPMPAVVYADACVPLEDRRNRIGVVHGIAGVRIHNILKITLQRIAGVDACEPQEDAFYSSSVSRFAG